MFFNNWCANRMILNEDGYAAINIMQKAVPDIWNDVLYGGDNH